MLLLCLPFLRGKKTLELKNIKTIAYFNNVLKYQITKNMSKIIITVINNRGYIFNAKGNNIPLNRLGFISYLLFPFMLLAPNNPNRRTQITLTFAPNTESWENSSAVWCLVREIQP